MRITLFSCSIIACVGIACAAAGARDDEKIAQVAAGQIEEAKASWWGFSPTDSTDALQAAINSGVRKLLVEDMGQPWVVRPIQLASDQEIVFEEGVVILAKRGEFKGRGDSLFTAALKENIVLRGHGAVFRMWQSDYDGPDYEKAEWRHTLSIRSSRHVEVLGLTLAESGGDGIYLGVSKRGVPCTDIVIRDVVCERNYRQGISVISAENLLIENTVMRQTGGTAPQAGIDFEPNHPSEKLVNCVMRNCVSENNAGNGYVFYLPNLHRSSDPISIRLEGCRSSGNRNGIVFITGNSADRAVRGTASFIDCTVIDEDGAGLRVERKPASGAEVRFVTCVARHCAEGKTDATPIMFATKAGGTQPIGGVQLVDCVVEQSRPGKVISYLDWEGGNRLLDVTGTVTVRGPADTRRIVLTQEWLDQTFPVRRIKDVPAYTMNVSGFTALKPDASRTVCSFSLRKEGTFVVCAEAGDPVSLTLANRRVARYSGEPMPVSVMSPSGVRHELGTVPFKGDAELTFKASENGLYRIPCSAGQNRIQLLAASHPTCLSAQDDAIRFYLTTGDFYFYVPADAGEFGVKVRGQGLGEAVRASLFDPSGRDVWSQDNITLVQMYSGRGAGVWRLSLERPSDTTFEDFQVELVGIPPFLGCAPDMLFKPTAR